MHGMNNPKLFVPFRHWEFREFTATSPTLHSEIHTQCRHVENHNFLSYIVRSASQVVVKNDKFDSCYVRNVAM